MKLKLVGCRRYNIDGELFVSHEPDGRTPTIYEVDTKKAEYLLKQYDPQTGFDYFEKYEGPLEGKKPAQAQDPDRVERRERPKQNDRRRTEAQQGRPARMGPRNQQDARLGAGRTGAASSRPIEEDGGTEAGAATV